LKERGFLIDVGHPDVGTVRFPRLPWMSSEGPQGNYEQPPCLGEYNDYVFRELLKMPEEEIAQLEEEQVIY